MSRVRPALAAVLLLTEADSAGFERPNATVTTILGAGQEKLSTEHELRAVQQRLDAAETNNRRNLENATDRVASHLTTLQAREQAARQQVGKLAAPVVAPA